MQETEMWVWCLGREDPLEKGIAPTLVSYLDNPMDRGAWQAMALQGIRHNWSKLAHALGAKIPHAL